MPRGTQINKNCRWSRVVGKGNMKDVALRGSLKSIEESKLCGMFGEGTVKGVGAEGNREMQ